ncbi:MAG: M28 family peptidase [Gemmatimonadetes bacterium]|nr:M28 family peptidase [Gemmatimonadota bacterium]
METVGNGRLLESGARGVQAAALMSLLAFAACGDSWTAPHNDAFSPEALKADIMAIADDSTAGRLVGTPEAAEVAQYIKGRFESMGLEPAEPGGSFEQTFDVQAFGLVPGSRLSIRGVGGARDPGNGWYPLNVSPLESGSGQVVFAGFGIVAPRLQWDDYKGADVSGKVVLVLEREPGVEDAASPFDGLVTATASREWNKALAAQQRGATAILFVRDVHTRPDVEDWAAAAKEYWPDEPRRVERFVHPAWAEPINIPGAFISVELARGLVKGSGRTLEELAQAAEAAQGGLGVVDLPGAYVDLKTVVERRRTPAMNIVAKVTGTDEALAGQAVIVLAHYDHNGATPDSIYNGADDNASGVAALLALAEAFKRAKDEELGPMRTVVFAATDSEERGPLLGASHLVMDPPFPLDSTVAVFNIDMIGRNEEVPADGGAKFNGLSPQTAESNANALNLIGYSRAPGLAAAVDSANKNIGLEIKRRYDNNASQLLRRSDQWPYLEHGIPAVWFFTGLHPDYHTTGDDEAKINYEKMVKIVRLIHQAVWNVANGEGRYTVEPMGTKPTS